MSGAMSEQNTLSESLDMYFKAKVDMEFINNLMMEPPCFIVGRNAAGGNSRVYSPARTICNAMERTFDQDVLIGVFRDEMNDPDTVFKLDAIYDNGKIIIERYYEDPEIGRPCRVDPYTFALSDVQCARMDRIMKTKANQVKSMAESQSDISLKENDIVDVQNAAKTKKQRRENERARSDQRKQDRKGKAFVQDRLAHDLDIMDGIDIPDDELLL